MSQGPLDRLAQLYGIAPFYHSVFGTRIEVPEATKRALLVAMEVPAGNDREVEASLDRAEADAWERLLPPVLVLGEHEPVHVPLAVPAGLAHWTVAWRLELEGGGVQEGEAALAGLAELERTRLHGHELRRLSLPLPVDLPLGYHRLEVQAEGQARMALIRAPERCWTVEEDVGDARVFGLSCQVYALRSARNLGAGDFEDLARLGEQAARAGADLVGVNPLHALFPADPNHISPYSPSSRLFLNVAAIAVDQIPELSSCPEVQAILNDPAFRAELERLRSTDLVDHVGAFRLKLQVLEALFRHFQSERLRPGALTARGRAFRAFRDERGEDLRRHALFEALHEAMLRDGRWAWTGWPEPMRDPDSPEVAAFARAHQDRVTFFAYLQWLADQQVAATQARLESAGMRIGLYCDLAVAVNPCGAATWADPHVMLRGVAVGAPPDIFNPGGQNWGLTPFSPRGLYESGYEPFVQAIRENMRHTGALRIDHVMGLERLFMIPDGMAGDEGAYVHYRFRDLLRILCLESRRQRCLVIGEDLGTVREGFRDELAAAGILSYRVFFFEREDGGLKPPEAYPDGALVSVSTHDLPTLRGYWEASDLAWRERIDPAPDASAYAAARAERLRERVVILQALAAAGLLPLGLDLTRPPEDLPFEVLLAVHRYMAGTPGRILMVQIEDALLEREQVNLPGTTHEHPNWRTRLRLPLEALFEDAGVRALLEAVRAERPRGESG